MMLVRTSTDMPMSFADAERRVAEGLESLLPMAVEESNQMARALELEVGFGNHPARVSTTVRAILGEPRRLGRLTVIPLSWSPTGGAGLLPDLVGELELAAMGGQRTELAISARYDPPAGMVGRLADKALLHRVAEATVRDLLQRIATSLSLQALPTP